VGGLYAGDHGLVAHQRPDLRPDSVWALLNEGGLCLVPGKRVMLRDRRPEVATAVDAFRNEAT